MPCVCGNPVSVEVMPPEDTSTPTLCQCFMTAMIWNYNSVMQGQESQVGVKRSILRWCRCQTRLQLPCMSSGVGVFVRQCAAFGVSPV